MDAQCPWFGGWTLPKLRIMFGGVPAHVEVALLSGVFYVSHFGVPFLLVRWEGET